MLKRLLSINRTSKERNEGKRPSAFLESQERRISSDTTASHSRRLEVNHQVHSLSRRSVELDNKSSGRERDHAQRSISGPSKSPLQNRSHNEQVESKNSVASGSTHAVDAQHLSTKHQAVKRNGASPGKPSPERPEDVVHSAPSTESARPSPPIFIDRQSPVIKPSTSKLLPFGDGSNKVFGFENFGNTCYCNSILQCLYHLDDFRDNILKYPSRPETMERRRKLKTVGNTPRIFTNESFLMPNMMGRSPPAETGGSSTREGQKTHEGEDGGGKESSGNKNSFIRGFSKGSGNQSSGSNKQKGLPKIEPVKATIMCADPITEKLHDGCQTVIVGRKMGHTNSGREHTPTEGVVEDASAPTKDSDQQNGYDPSRDNAEVDPSIASFEILRRRGETSEDRKKAALISGPVINIDRMINVAAKANLYNGLKDIFECVTENENLTGVVSPIQLVKILKKENILFNSVMQQDAHEFLNFLLNDLNEYNQCGNDPEVRNAILDQFQGTLTNKSKCLTCDAETSSDEPFLDLPIEIKTNEERIDIQEMLKSFHQREILSGSNKFYCNQCYGLQEAERVVGLKKLPKTLALHLKRFKYVEERNTNIKLFNPIHYPLTLEVCSTFDPSISKTYELKGVVVHLGSSPQHGHYVAVCKSELYGWLLADDETIESVKESTVLRFVGNPHDHATAYVLFYREIPKEKAELVKPDQDFEVHEKHIKELITYDDSVRRKQAEIEKELELAAAIRERENLDLDPPKSKRNSLISRSNSKSERVKDAKGIGSGTGKGKKGSKRILGFIKA